MYTSRSGNIYHLYSKLTNKGNTKYYMSTKIQPGEILEIPKNYEIYENPNGTVTLSKSFVRILNKNQITTIENCMEKHCKNAAYIIDEKKDGIEVFVDEMFRKKLSAVELSIISMGIMKSNKTVYIPTFKISKDMIINEFIIERYFWGGGSQNWIYLEKDKRIKYLCDKYFVHINKESFYELM